MSIEGELYPHMPFILSIQTYWSLVDAQSGIFQRVRHQRWRWFDFLWMSHTMDYNGRDNFNNLLLRIFSLFGVLTVMSGFLLWGTCSPSLRKWIKK